MTYKENIEILKTINKLFNKIKDFINKIEDKLNRFLILNLQHKIKKF